MAVNVTREKNKLKIELPLESPTPSQSGKTMVVASSHGVITTEVEYEGRPVALVVNAFIYPKDQRKRVARTNTAEQSARKPSAGNESKG